MRYIDSQIYITPPALHDILGDKADTPSLFRV